MKKIPAGIIVFNILVLILFLLYLNDTGSIKLNIVAALLLVISLIGLTIMRYSGKRVESLQNVHLLVFTLIIFCFFLEMLVFIPNLVPLQIRNYLDINNNRTSRRQVVEYLDRPPFAKFKPNVVVTSQGYRGPSTQFVYQWKTDKLGFKNLDEVLENGRIEIVAVGDSFTEGMGVSIEDTWPAILTKRGHITYNLGVQGYAPTQLEGSFRLYGYDLKPRYVVIGYCAGTYPRERAFLDKQSIVEQKRLTGGIDSIARSDRKEIRKQSKHVTLAIFLFLADYSYSFKRDIADRIKSKGVTSKLDNRYTCELLRVEYEKGDISKISASPEYKQALNAFLEIKRLSGEIGSKVIFIYLPSRSYMYYEAGFGKKLPDDSFELVESRMLKEFCEKEGMAYLNPSGRITGYVANLKGGASSDLYPYLEIDGHFSRRGNLLIAEEILSYLQSAEHATPKKR